MASYLSCIRSMLRVRTLDTSRLTFEPDEGLLKTRPKNTIIRIDQKEYGKYNYVFIIVNM